MNKTKVKFYRGTKGMGVVISVSYNNDRIIFDFGAPFTPLSEIYDGEVKVRNQNRVKDAILLGRIPNVDGVFKKEDLKDLDTISYEDSDFNTAIFICHLHLDHMSEIDKVHPDIPVYIHSQGLKMQELIDEMEDNKIYRTYNPFEYEQTINVGSIKVTPYFSDHPCAGSASFLIETKDQTILYSGDIRYHGTNRDKAFKVIEELNKKDIDLLIIDSTTTSPAEFDRNKNYDEFNKPSKDYLFDSISEQDIYDSIYHNLNNYNGIGVFNMYPRDINMLKNMYELGVKLNRKTVFEPYYANILYNLTNIKSAIIIPNTKHNNEYINKLKDICEVIDINDIKNNPQNYLLQNSYQNILTLIDLDGINGKYYHLLGEPLVKGTKEYNIMTNFIDKLNWNFETFINLYSFSHAYPNHLSYVVKSINAKSVVAVHSKNPENLNPVNSKQFFPIEGVEYSLVNGELKEN